MSSDGRFDSVVSLACHDLRTPLATIYGFARTLPRVVELDEKATVHANILSGAQRVLDLIAEYELAPGESARSAILLDQIAHFDGVAIQDILIAPRAVNIDPQMAEAIDMAIARVEAFHRQQLPVGYTWNHDGTEVLKCLQSRHPG